MTFLFLMLSMVALIVSVLLFVFARDRVTVWEAVAVFAFSVSIIATIAFAIPMRKSADFSVLTGEVQSKSREKTSCAHSYGCDCRRDSKGRRTCHRTCYHHSYDVDWVVRSNIGSLIVPRINGRGDKEPPRWTVIQAGDPFARVDPHTNYVKGASHTLFRDVTLSDAERKLYPTYPGVYDLYRRDPVVLHGKAKVPNAKAWSKALNEAQRSLGPKKQVDMVIVFTAETDPDWARRLEAAWHGGKRNSAVTVVSVTEWPKINWSYGFTFANSSGNAMSAIVLRDALAEPTSLADPEGTVAEMMAGLEKSFKRKSMGDFAYLASEAKLTGAEMFWSMLFLLLAVGAASMFVVHNRLTPNGTSTFRNRHY